MATRGNVWTIGSGEEDRGKSSDRGRKEKKRRPQERNKSEPVTEVRYPLDLQRQWNVGRDGQKTEVLRGKKLCLSG